MVGVMYLVVSGGVSVGVGVGCERGEDRVGVMGMWGGVWLSGLGNVGRCLCVW